MYTHIHYGFLVKMTHPYGNKDEDEDEDSLGVGHYKEVICIPVQSTTLIRKTQQAGDGYDGRKLLNSKYKLLLITD